MPKRPEELRNYKHQKLIDQLNNFMIASKIHFGYLEDRPEEIVEKLKVNYPKPTIEEIDELTMTLYNILREDSEPMRKY